MELGRCDTLENKMCQKGIASETTMKMMRKEVGMYRRYVLHKGMCI